MNVPIEFDRPRRCSRPIHLRSLLKPPRLLPRREPRRLWHHPSNDDWRGRTADKHRMAL